VPALTVVLVVDRVDFLVVTFASIACGLGWSGVSEREEGEVRKGGGGALHVRLQRMWSVSGRWQRGTLGMQREGWQWWWWMMVEVVCSLSPHNTKKPTQWTKHADVERRKRLKHTNTHGWFTVRNVGGGEWYPL
jgi:hypothetical protein